MAVNLFDMIGSRAAFPFLYSVLSAQSAYNKLRAIGHKPTIHWEEPYESKPIALVALYQKGRLRDDSRVLMSTLKKQGCYVFAVNTLRLESPDSIRDVCDCYVEKINFGRDFGSYKFGFQFLYKRGWETNCPRLLMINDSVFCVSDRIRKFLKDMMESEAEVLGSTENFEIIHHLGSFCISVSSSVLKHEKFKGFWKRYQDSDVRNRVIRYGEQELSKTLKKCVSAPSQFRTLYGTSEFLRRLQEDDGMIDEAIRNARNSDLTGWKRFSAEKVLTELREKYLLRSREIPTDATLKFESDALSDRVFANDVKGIVEVAEKELEPSKKIDPELIRDIVISQLTEVYMSGSQIHQNASTLLKMGLPIIKLDGLYRGMFTVQDIQLISNQIPRGEAVELQRLLLERPYGGDALRGWKRAAFMRGLI